MKIIIISRYPPFPGGRENFVFELSNQLSKDNKVLIITPDQEDFDGDNLMIRKYPETKESLEKIIKDFQPDIINSHTFYLSKDAAGIAKDMNISFGITLHGDQFAIGDQQRQNIVKEIVLMSDFVNLICRLCLKIRCLIQFKNVFKNFGLRVSRCGSLIIRLI